MDKFQGIQKIRKTLARGEPSIGSWMQIPNASLAEIMGAAGYDWVAVDLEHGSISQESLPDIFRALELGGTLPLARVANGFPKECKQALDAGAAGIIVPMIETREQALAAHASCCWPPLGKRGVGYSRANLFGKNFNSYAKDESQKPLFVVMIEHINGVENLADILSIKGIDAVLIGPYDLSASMGMTGQFNSKEFKKAIQLVLQTTSKYKVPCGFHQVSPNTKELDSLVRLGYTFIAYGIDAVFLNTIIGRPAY